jgi:ElaB/YqjD/DUF883 family membrane-anchored ribosome-binding protein
MESNTTTGNERTTTGTSDPAGYNPTGSAPQRAKQAAEKASDILGKGTEAVNQAYTQATETLNDTVQQAVTYGKQAVSYGRENPGTAALIAFGAGIGLGILIGSSLNSRSKTTRIINPIMGALTDIAAEIFR